ncbi:MAG: helix-turn-helix domain-containing protein [Oscillospiraceae bacterium]|jgi:transcriptional regulator with XRE-family HTH domain|nr:helix-turn-helix domain-containing protein [Oscillospiraceae bacterium]
MIFGEILQLLMEENNITPKQLARHLRISATILNNYTRCVSEPDFDTLKRIAASFEVRIDDLLDYHGAPAHRD